MTLLTRLFVLFFLTFSISAHGTEESNKPYSTKVWASVLFDNTGKAIDIRIINESLYPTKFLEHVKNRIADTQIEPPQLEARSVSFQTGTRLNYTITPSKNGGNATFKDMYFSPLPIREYFANFPAELAYENSWEGKLNVICQVAIDGMCASIDVKAVSGQLPEVARKYARDSMKKWEFEPQQLDGKPVSSEFQLNLNLMSDPHIISDPRRYLRK